jgi:hypothetical protein
VHHAIQAACPMDVVWKGIARIFDSCIEGKTKGK